MLTIGSLFSGIAGLELGLEWAGLGPVIWQVEKDPFCRRVLEKHYPEVQRFDDVCTVGAAELARVDLICGGFPCQDVSPAGTRKGLAGERSGLWREFARVASELDPEWLVTENTGDGIRWVDVVACGLEELGYDCLPCPITAWSVGASHTRPRVFLVARRARCDCEHSRSEHDWILGSECRLCSCASFVPSDAAAKRFNEGLPRSRVGALAESRQRSSASGAFQGSVEPDLVRAIHGIPDRVDRVAALGNAVVPQCAEVVGWVIRELAGLTPERGFA